MAEDREILREIWDGRVPVCVQLASEDCNTLSAPDPYYLMVPRLSYFPLVMDKVRKHLLRFIPPDLQEAEMWFECDGYPLKWHYPVGVLFDLHCGGTALPWTITAHFSHFPEKELIRCPSREVVESQFMSSLKEADGLKHRGQVITNMQSKDHKQLWMGLCNDKFDQFWAINRKLMECCSDEGFKHIPFRLHTLYRPPIQKLIKPLTDDGRKVTLADLLHDALPDTIGEGDRIVIQGIETPLDTPVQWLSEHLSHPDNFLHISYIPAQA
ncbi:autophagy protein 5 [Macrobrachium rosenbergii]|uniref:autophagy protein 5 n=1 Tax=Macrobrachium rosenbergii TaxID=79674 RepID=UPI0034D6E8AC